jgi:hypothetical protein
MPYRPLAGTDGVFPVPVPVPNDSNVRYSDPLRFAATTRSASAGDTSKVINPLFAAVELGWPLPPWALAAVS